jgi:hypothetical protein
VPENVVVGKHTRWSEGNSNDFVHEWTNPNKIAVTTKCVCALCNSGWMSKIESEAIPFLRPMIEDQVVTLDNAAQERIATWLSLKACVSQYAVTPGQVEKRWADDFGRNRLPPTTWQIRIGRYSGQQAMTLGNTGVDFHGKHALVQSSVSQHGFLFTISLRSFVGQVIGIGTRCDIPFRRESFVQIWPHPLLRATAPNLSGLVAEAWPPKLVLSEADLHQCSRDPLKP